MDKAEFDRATAQGAREAAEIPQAIKAHVSDDGNLHVKLSTGKWLVLPLRDIEGLSNARPADLRRIEIGPAGTSLRFPAIDEDVYVPGLIAGITGTKRWMAGER